MMLFALIVFLFTFKKYVSPSLSLFLSLSYICVHVFIIRYPSSYKIKSWLLSIKVNERASLVAQWLRICLLMQGTRVRALVWEDPTCHGAAGPVSHNC